MCFAPNCDQDELERKVRMTGEVLELVHGILEDLVLALPDEHQKEYSDDMDRIADRVRFIR
jgi:hypothetical protein